MDGDVIFLLARSDIARYSYTTSVVRVVSRFRCLGYSTWPAQLSLCTTCVRRVGKSPWPGCRWRILHYWLHCKTVIFPPQRSRRSQRLKIILSFIEHGIVNIFLTMRPMAKNDPWLHCKKAIVSPQRPQRSQRLKIDLSSVKIDRKKFFLYALKGWKITLLLINLARSVRPMCSMIGFCSRFILLFINLTRSVYSVCSVVSFCSALNCDAPKRMFAQVFVPFLNDG